MKLSKKDFEKNYKPKEVEELYDPNSGKIGGDTVITHNQVRTDTPVLPGDDSTDREEDIPTDTEKHVSATRNAFSDWAKSRYGMGVPYGYARQSEGTIKENAKEKMRKIVKELLSRRNDTTDIINTQNSTTPTLDNIDDKEVALKAKVEELIDVLATQSPDIIKTVMDYINYKVTEKNNNL